MAESAENADSHSKVAAESVVEDFVKTLSPEHRMLVVLKTQLYSGTWEPMLNDLENRLAGKPYIFKLAGRIKQDVHRIKQMQQFENEHKLDLADYIDSIE